VHRALGPGLIEPVYERCLCHELNDRGLKFKSQVAVPILYRGVQLDAALRLDLLVEDCVIVELKAVENLIPLCEAPASDLFEVGEQAARPAYQLQCAAAQRRD
jgi:GxxExxY protein